MIEFLAGLIIGASILLLVLYLVVKPKTEAKTEQASVTPSAIGLDMSGKHAIASLEPYYARMLKTVLERYEAQNGVA